MVRLPLLEFWQGHLPLRTALVSQALQSPVPPPSSPCTVSCAATLLMAPTAANPALMAWKRCVLPTSTTYNILTASRLVRASQLMCTFWCQGIQQLLLYICHQWMCGWLLTHDVQSSLHSCCTCNLIADIYDKHGHLRPLSLTKALKNRLA